MPKLTFLGHSAFLLELKGASIVFDPFLTGNPKAQRGPGDVKVDYIILTHGHGDHVGDAIQIAKDNNATIISNYEIATYAGGQGVNAHPMHLGGGHEFPFGRVKLTIAHHGSGLETDEGGMRYMGNPAGVLVIADGKTLYHAGDTALFYDMKLMGEMNSIDAALLPIGDNFTMGVDDAVKAVEFLNPKMVVPMHYGTFDVIDVDVNDFAQKVEARGFSVRIVGVEESTSY